LVRHHQRPRRGRAGRRRETGRCPDVDIQMTEITKKMPENTELIHIHTYIHTYIHMYNSHSRLCFLLKNRSNFFQ
jgi:hypothetical protein